MILSAGHTLMAEVGFARFSARAVAKRIGYSVGTIFNVFDSHDRLVMAINTRTFGLWTTHLRARLDAAGKDRVAALVRGYFDFARAQPLLWLAIHDHRPPPAMTMSAADTAARGELTAIVAAETARALGADAGVSALTRSLVATVHGHCHLALTGAFALMGEEDPESAALARVREALAAR